MGAVASSPFTEGAPNGFQSMRSEIWRHTDDARSGMMAYAFDGIYIGATWARDMRNLMLLSLAFYFAAWALLLPLGNTGLWLALLIFLLARGGFQASRRWFSALPCSAASPRALGDPGLRPALLAAWLDECGV